MMKFFILLVLLTTLLTYRAYADSGIGIVLGDPTGISGRLGLDNRHSLEGALAYSSSHYEGLHLHATYLWDRARTIGTSEGPLEMYYGLGVRVITIQEGKYDGDVAVGPRAPLGLLYNFTNPNLEVFGEISAALDLAPKTDVDLDVGLGIRVRF